MEAQKTPKNDHVFLNPHGIGTGTKKSLIPHISNYDQGEKVDPKIQNPLFSSLIMTVPQVFN
jgi:hypothetical protein